MHNFREVEFTVFFTTEGTEDTERFLLSMMFDDPIFRKSELRWVRTHAITHKYVERSNLAILTVFFYHREHRGHREVLTQRNSDFLKIESSNIMLNKNLSVSSVLSVVKKTVNLNLSKVMPFFFFMNTSVVKKMKISLMKTASDKEPIYL